MGRPKCRAIDKSEFVFFCFPTCGTHPLQTERIGGLSSEARQKPALIKFSGKDERYMNQQPNLDLGRLAQATDMLDDAPDAEEHTHESTPNTLALTSSHTRSVAISTADVAWMEATRGLQNNLIRSLQNYKTGWRDRKIIAEHRQRMVDEVMTQYVDYLREEAKLASQAALQARDAVLRQELAKLRASLFTQLADISGKAVNDIEKIFQSHAATLTSPFLQEAYAKFVMNKVLELLEQPGR